MASSELALDLLTKAMGHFEEARPLIPMYIHLIASAILPMYIGAHASLSRPSSAAKPRKKKKKENGSGDEDEDEEEDEDHKQKMEGMSNSDAIILPVTAAFVLGGMYFLITRYGADTINKIFSLYFSGVGLVSLAKLINDGVTILINFLAPNYYVDCGTLWRIDTTERQAIQQDQTKAPKVLSSPLPPPLNRLPLPRPLTNTLWTLRHALRQKYSLRAYLPPILDIHTTLTLPTTLATFASLAAILYTTLIDRPWFLTNLQGLAVCYSALQFMSPTTFATGSLILAALFCYDIWAVFFTPLMVTVAKNLDQPIKMVFPRPDEPGPDGGPPVKSFSMLGLGDIVLPGLIIALALRFDLYLFYLRKQTKVTNPDDPTAEPALHREPYIPVTGHRGDRFWTSSWIPWRAPRATEHMPPRLRASFPKPYFTAAMVGYVVGMVATMAVMSVWKHAQPALLYLVPGVLGGVWGAAVVRGEVGVVWGFSEAVGGEEEEGGSGKGEGKEGEKEGGEGKNGAEVEREAKGLFERLWAEIWAGNPQEEKEGKKKTDDAAKASKNAEKSHDEKSDQTSKKRHDFKSKDVPYDDDTLIFFSLTRHDPKRSKAGKKEKSSKKDKKSKKSKGSSKEPECSGELSGDAGSAPEEPTVAKAVEAEEAPEKLRRRTRGSMKAGS